MSDAASLWYAAAELARSETPGAIATVSRRRGSLPMARNAKMLVAADGQRWGTIGGGCIEAEVTEQALGAAHAGSPGFVQHMLNADLAGDVGLSCGGTVELFLEPVVHSDEMARLYHATAAAVERREFVRLYTATEWTHGPAKAALIGEQQIVVGDLHPPGAPRHGSPPRDPRPDTPRSSNTQGIAPGAARPAHRAAGEVAHVDADSGLFIEPIPRIPRVIIVGAGHVGVEIARVAAGAGFHVVVADDRAEFANAVRIPDAHEIVVEDFRSLLDRLELDEDDYVLATTRGHAFDAYVIERTAGSRARYVGMLGSRRKKEVIFKALSAAGVSAEALGRVRVPIGEPIGADTPEEIAVSVVAELIRVRRTA